MSRQVAKEVQAHPMGSRSHPDPSRGYNSPICTRTCSRREGTQARAGCAPTPGCWVLPGPPAPAPSPRSSSVCGTRTADGAGDGAGDNFISLANEALFLPYPISGAVISTPLPTSLRSLLHSLQFVHSAPTNIHFYFKGSPGRHCVLTILLQTVDQAGLLINEVMTVNLIITTQQLAFLANMVP